MSDDSTLYTRMKEWSEVNPHGKVVKVEIDKSIWPQYLIRRGTESSGVYIHNLESKWKYFKLNMGTATLKGDESLEISQDAKSTLNIIARQCISTAWPPLHNIPIANER